MNIAPNTLDQALKLFGVLIESNHAGPYRLVICGGAALIACSISSRVTQDVDILALMNSRAELINPDPLPKRLIEIAQRVASDLNLPENWLNNGPSKNPGGLFQVGLPKGIETRLTRKDYGTALTAYFVGRFDQIHFKLFAAADQGPGRHYEDLKILHPTETEIQQAAEWAVKHDSSPGFIASLKSMLEQMGYGHVAE